MRGCEVVNLPHDFQLYQPWVAPGADERANSKDAANNVKSRLSARGFKEMGIGWSRYKLTPQEEWKGRRVMLDFGGMMLVGDVYVSGFLPTRTIVLLRSMSTSLRAGFRERSCLGQC